MWLPDIIQVEVTTACQAECIFCPHTTLHDNWISQHIKWEDFSEVLPAVHRGTLVHLQGWGEPLLHPRLWDMAAAVKQKQGRVSLTTNGGLMDDEVSRELCRLKFDFVAVSLAGATPAVHNSLRPGPGLDLICANIERLSSMKSKPDIHLDFQMMKPNLEQLPGLVDLAARLGARRVIASNLDCITGPETEALRAFGKVANREAAEIIEAARRLGKEKNIEVDVYPLRLQANVPVCKADPLHTVVVTAAGNIAPCVYLCLPLRSEIPRLFEGKKEAFAPFSYGHVSRGFQKVTGGQAARNFRETFEQRMQEAVMANSKRVALLVLPGLRSVRDVTAVKGEDLTSPAPELCRHCYKLYGI